jgi:hypothetical protein
MVETRHKVWKTYRHPQAFLRLFVGLGLGRKQEKTPGVGRRRRLAGLVRCTVLQSCILSRGIFKGDNNKPPNSIRAASFAVITNVGLRWYIPTSACFIHEFCSV